MAHGCGRRCPLDTVELVCGVGGGGGCGLFLPTVRRQEGWEGRPARPRGCRVRVWAGGAAGWPSRKRPACLTPVTLAEDVCTSRPCTLAACHYLAWPSGTSHCLALLPSLNEQLPTCPAWWWVGLFPLQGSRVSPHDPEHCPSKPCNASDPCVPRVPHGQHGGPVLYLPRP